MELMPIEEHGWKRRQQPIRHFFVFRASRIQLKTSQDGTGRPQHIHRMRARRKLFEHSLQRRRQTSQRAQFPAVTVEFTPIGQMAVQQEKRNLLKRRFRRKILDGITSVSQTDAFFANGRNRRLPGDDPCQPACFFIRAHR